MKNKLLIAIAAIGLTFSSCENVVDGLNDNPNRFTDTSLGLVLNHANLNVATVVQSDMARISSMFSDQFTGDDRQYTAFNGYQVGSSDFTRHWNSLYLRGISQAQIAKKKASESGNTTLEGVATILEAYYFGEAALLYGDIPFSEVNRVEEFSDPRYEGQQSVLEAVIGMLKSGGEKAGAASVANAVFSTSSTWQQVANLLAARYELALKKYGDALASAQAASFETPANTVSINHGTSSGSENLYWQWEVKERTGYLKVNGADGTRSTMWQMLEPTSDKYKGNDKTDETGRRDWYTAADSTNLNTTNGFAAITQAVEAFSFSEAQLIIAETAARTGSTDVALAALNKVRTANAAQYGKKYDAYEMSDFEAGGMVNNGLSTSEAMILEILKEKYCSVLGLPTYQDVRRTKNVLGVAIKKSGASSIPQRFLYPANEVASNSSIKTENGGPGLIDLYEPTPINK